MRPTVLALILGCGLLAATAPALTDPALTPRPAPGLGATVDDDTADDGASTRRDPRLRSKRRLLRLGSGQVLRGDAKLVDEHWEVESRSGRVTTVPATFVTADLLEKDVLKEMRGRASKVRRAGPIEKVGLSRWMLEQGLLKEGFEELDTLLGESPDQPEALALLADQAPLIGLPAINGQAVDTAGAVDELIEFASRAPITLRELAVLRLTEVDDADGLHEALVAQLYIDESGRRAFATLALRRLYPQQLDEQLADRLLVHALMDRYPDVRQGASLALRDAGEPGLQVNLIDALGSGSSSIRTHAAEALGSFGPQAPLAIEPLVNQLAVAASGGGGTGPRATVFIGTQRAYVSGFDADVAQNAAIADPIVSVIQEGVVLDAKVMGVSSREFGAVRTALSKITGADPGSTRRSWEKWWDQNRDQY